LASFELVFQNFLRKQDTCNMVRTKTKSEKEKKEEEIVRQVQVIDALVN
jgi:hypothetical protein